MNLLSRIIGHTCLVLRHKFWVFRFACVAGIPWQGIVHDLSKFSWTEFSESVRYYNGKVSPIKTCKEKNHGLSMAWIHHHGRNLHHYEAWYDNFDHGPVPRDMPYKYAVEMVCDCLAAGRTYGGKDFTYAAEYNGWWKRRLRDGCGMSDNMKKFMEAVLGRLARENSLAALRPESTKAIYAQTVGEDPLDF